MESIARKSDGRRIFTPEFKRQQIELFTSLIEPESELLHLPDGRTLSTVVNRSRQRWKRQCPGRIVSHFCTLQECSWAETRGQ